MNYTTGMGLLEGSCQGAGGMGDEHIYTVTVPAGGPFDLVASTPPMAAMGPDTLLYDRTVCGDPSTETACNDDASAMPHVIAAAIEVLNAAPGTHFIVADIFDTQTMAMSSMLTVGLRPVLASAAVCDPMGVMNRCHAAACPTTGTADCP